MKAKNIYLVLALVLTASVSKGQTSMETFLGSALQDSELDIYTKQINYLNEGQYRLAPIRQVELRTQNNELGSGEQQYGLRISPSNPWEVKQNNQVFNTRQTILSLQKELTFKTLLEKRYQLVLDIIYYNEMRTIREMGMQNTADKLTVLEKMKASSSFDAEEYLELKLGQMEEQTDLGAFNFEIAQKRQELKKAHASTDWLMGSNWTYKTMISLPKLENLVDSLKTTAMFSTRLAYRQGKITLAEHEYSLEKNNINLGFIQSEYMPYKLVENKKSPLGISMGINIPLFNPNKAAMAERKLDILEALNELSLEKQMAEEEVNTLLNSLKGNLERHHKLDMMIRSYDEKKTFASVNALTQNNPLFALKLKAQRIKFQKAQVELKNEIYQSYIKLLSTTDLLNQKPLTNYLSNQLQPL